MTNQRCVGHTQYNKCLQALRCSGAHPTLSFSLSQSGPPSTHDNVVVTQYTRRQQQNLTCVHTVPYSHELNTSVMQLMETSEKSYENIKTCLLSLSFVKLKLTQIVREKLQFLKQNLVTHTLFETQWFKYFSDIR